MNLTLKFDPKFEKAMAKAPERMRTAIIRGLNRGSEIVVKAAVGNLTRNRSILSNTLRNAMSSGWRVDTRALRSTIGPTMNRRYGQKVNYGFFVEHGRRPGKMPPVGALREFLRKKVEGVTEANIARREYGLRLGIAKKGTVHNKQPFLEPALKNNTAAIQKAFDRELQAELDAMDGEAK